MGRWVRTWRGIWGKRTEQVYGEDRLVDWGYRRLAAIVVESAIWERLESFASTGGKSSGWEPVGGAHPCLCVNAEGRIEVA